MLSFIIYLNPGWDPADGGALRVFPAYEYGWGTAESQRAPHLEDVLPEGGTLVLLCSGDVEHLVRETRAERQCVVGWFHEASRAPTLDLAPTSLRTLRKLNRPATVRSCRELVDTFDRSQGGGLEARQHRSERKGGVRSSVRSREV